MSEDTVVLLTGGYSGDGVRLSSTEVFPSSKISTFMAAGCTFLPDVCARLITEVAGGSEVLPVSQTQLHCQPAQDNIDELQAFIKRKPRTKLAPPRPPPGQGNAMLMWREKQHGVARALGGAAQFVRTASGRLLGAGQQPTVAVAIPVAHGTEVKLS